MRALMWHSGRTVVYLTPNPGLSPAHSLWLQLLNDSFHLILICPPTQTHTHTHTHIHSRMSHRTNIKSGL